MSEQGKFHVQKEEGVSKEAFHLKKEEVEKGEGVSREAFHLHKEE